MPLTYDRLLLAKLESTYGTSSAPTGTDAIRVNNLNCDPLKMGLVTREILYPHASNRPRLVTQRVSEVSFDFELAGSGTAGTPPKTGIFFRAAGYSETIVASTSVTYAPIGSNFEGITIDARVGRKRHLLTGVRGTLDFEFKTNQIPIGKFTGMGFYTAPTDVANPSQTFSNQATPAIFNADNTQTISVHGFAACMESFSFKTGRSPQVHQRAGCTKQIRIDTERACELEFMIESPTIAEKDYFTAAANQTLAGISFTHGLTAGNILAFASSGISLGEPAYDDANGVEMLTCSGSPIPSPTNGYDDHSWIFT